MAPDARGEGGAHEVVSDSAKTPEAPPVVPESNPEAQASRYMRPRRRDEDCRTYLQRIMMIR